MRRKQNTKNWESYGGWNTSGLDHGNQWVRCGVFPLSNITCQIEAGVLEPSIIVWNTGFIFNFGVNSVTCDTHAWKIYNIDSRNNTYKRYSGLSKQLIPTNFY